MDIMRSMTSILRAAALASTLFLALTAYRAVPANAGETTIRMEEPVGLDRTAWPAGLGFPFRKGI